MIKEDFLVATKTGAQIIGKFWGNENSKSLLICVHGFGVRMDSYGLFDDICEHFQNDFLTVQFNLNTVDDVAKTSFAADLNTQIEKLATIVQRLNQKFGDKELILVAHSQGCVVASTFALQANLKLKKLFLLAPPPSNQVVEKYKKYYSNRPGSEINEQGTSVVVRSDGSKTFIPPSYWPSFTNVNSLELYSSVGKVFDTTYVVPIGDKMISQEDYASLKSIVSKEKYFEISTGHDFREDERKSLVEVLDCNI